VKTQKKHIAYILNKHDVKYHSNKSLHSKLIANIRACFYLFANSKTKNKQFNNLPWTLKD